MRRALDRRRALRGALAVVGFLNSPLTCAQADRKMFRIGAVSAGAGRAAPHWVAFDQQLVELGYVEGRNLVLLFRNAEGNPERLPSLMAELARASVDVIFAPGPEASLKAAREAFPTIPIVIVAIDYDPVERGHVSGFARPDGNISGVYLPQLELTAKRLQLLKEAIPNLRQVVTFWDSFSKAQSDQADAAARSLGLSLQRVEFHSPPYSFDAPMKTAVENRAGALLGMASPVFFRQRAELGTAAIRHRLPAVSPFPEAAEQGMLLAYGANLPDTHRRAAAYIDKILRGAHPRDLPMEQPNKFQLIVNAMTARTLGMTISQSIKLQADQVIDR